MAEEITIKEITIENKIINNFLEMNGYDFINDDKNKKHTKIKNEIFDSITPLIKKLEILKSKKENDDKIKNEKEKIKIEKEKKKQELKIIKNILSATVSKKNIYVVLINMLMKTKIN